LAEVLLRN